MDTRIEPTPLERAVLEEREACAKIADYGGNFMKILMLALCLATSALADERYNAMSGEWEAAGSDEALRYNPMENTWSYEERDADLEYQPMQGKWDYDPSPASRPLSRPWTVRRRDHPHTTSIHEP